MGSRGPKLLLAVALACQCGGSIAAAPAAGWTNIGPPGGAPHGLAADPDDGHHVVALTPHGRIIETRDRGASWHEGGRAPCPASAGSAFHDGAFYVVCDYGIWRTRDAGASWEKFSQKSSALSTISYRKLIFNPAASGHAVVFAFSVDVSGPAVSVTISDGRTWQNVRFIDVPGTGAFAAAPQPRLLAVDNRSTGPDYRAVVYESFDGGVAWTPVGRPIIASEPGSCHARAIAADAAARLYVASDCGIDVSSDNGETWAHHPKASLGDAFMGMAAVVVSRATGAVVVQALDALWESVDGGRSWARLSLPAREIGNADFAPDGTLWIATSAGVFRREGGGWGGPGTGMRSAGVQSLLLDADPSTMYASGSGMDTMRSRDHGATWEAFEVAGERRQALLLPSATQPGALYAVLGYSSSQPTKPRLYASNDAGTSWEVVNPAVQTPDGRAIGNFAMAGPQPGIIYGSYLLPAPCDFGNCFVDARGVVISKDGGRSWALAENGLSGSSPLIRPAPSDARVAYAWTSDGIFRTRDSGASWSRIWSTPLRRDLLLLVDARDPALIYLQGDRNSLLWVSSNGGDDWRQASLPSVHGDSIALQVDPVDSGRLYVVGDDVHESLDRGATWRRIAIDARDGIAALRVAARGGARTFLAANEGTVVALTPDAGALVLGSDLWWNPAESGHGLTITQHASGQMFVVWYGYDTTGRQTWRVVPGGQWTGEREFTGTMYETAGPAYFFDAFDPRRVRINPVGTATLRFDDANAASFHYEMHDGHRGETRIVRQLFGPPQASPGVDRSDLWWNEYESGWGMGISHQYGTLFATWYVYDELGKPQWVVMPDGRLSVSDAVQAYDGELYVTSGPPLGQPFDPARVARTRVGSARIAFMGRDEGWVAYEAFGQARTRRITRQPF